MRRRALLAASASSGGASYKRLEYIESTGSQYIDLGYIVKDTDVIEMEYEITKTTSGDKMFFGVKKSTGLWVSWTSSSGYVRFGSSSSIGTGNMLTSTHLVLKKKSLTYGTTTKTPAYSSMPQASLYLFARHNEGAVDAYGYYRLKEFSITGASGEGDKWQGGETSSY